MAASRKIRVSLSDARTHGEKGLFVAKQKQPDDKLLIEPLSKLMGGDPARQTGTAAAPGIFPGSAAAQKKLLARALELGYLEECEGPPPPAPKKKGGKPA